MRRNESFGGGLAPLLITCLLMGATGCERTSAAEVFGTKTDVASGASVVGFDSDSSRAEPAHEQHLTGDASLNDPSSLIDETKASADTYDETLRPWEDVEADAYDTIVGSGFGEDKFVNYWGDFGDEGRHRPDLSVMFQEDLGRALSAEERTQLTLRFDEHEDSIRGAAINAYHALRIALDDVWHSGLVVHRPKADPATKDESESAYQEARGLGGYTYCDSFTTGGWQVQVIVPSPNYPEFHHAFKELRRAVLAREADARQMLGLS